MIRSLLNPITHQVVAELEPDKEIRILDTHLLNKLKANGITIDASFKEQYQLDKWRVYPNDDCAIFAKAFELFYFVHGLQQQGYQWMDNLQHESDPKKVAERILASYRNQDK